MCIMCLQISQYLQEVATTSTRAELHTAGKSYENKTIEYLKVIYTCINVTFQLIKLIENKTLFKIENGNLA